LLLRNSIPTTPEAETVCRKSSQLHPSQPQAQPQHQSHDDDEDNDDDDISSFLKANRISVVEKGAGTIYNVAEKTSNTYHNNDHEDIINSLNNNNSIDNDSHGDPAAAACFLKIVGKWKEDGEDESGFYSLADTPFLLRKLQLVQYDAAKDGDANNNDVEEERKHNDCGDCGGCDDDDSNSIVDDQYNERRQRSEHCHALTPTDKCDNNDNNNIKGGLTKLEKKLERKRYQLPLPFNVSRHNDDTMTTGTNEARIGSSTVTIACSTSIITCDDDGAVSTTAVLLG
jgi:hypothetical protein